MKIKIMAFIDDRIKWLRYSGDQNVISDLIIKFEKLGHFLIHGHNHINGMIEKVNDTTR